MELAVCSLLFSGIISAQVITGTISGTVSDPTGAVLPGARITVKNVETGIARAATTDAMGRYTAAELGLGSYEVSTEAPGFQTAIRSGITLTVGRAAVVDFTLLQSNYGAQYGRAAGGVVNAVTQSGTNTMHGTVFEFLRN